MINITKFFSEEQRVVWVRKTLSLKKLKEKDCHLLEIPKEGEENINEIEVKITAHDVNRVRRAKEQTKHFYKIIRQPPPNLWFHRISGDYFVCFYNFNYIYIYTYIYCYLLIFSKKIDCYYQAEYGDGGESILVYLNNTKMNYNNFFQIHL